MAGGKRKGRNIGGSWSKGRGEVRGGELKGKRV